VAAVEDHASLAERVIFSASVGMEHCQHVATFLWEFGDGATSTSSLATHQFAAPGVYTWHMTATADGVTCTESGTITVLNPPSITLMKKVAPPFKIVVTGTNLQNGVRVFIDGVEWSSVVWKKAEKLQLTGGAGLKAAVPKGASKTFRFVNPDGGEASVNWNW
jgi:PKD repeat protein